MTIEPVSENTSTRTPELSVVSPVYLAEDCVGELCRQLADVLDEMDVDYEIVLVEDGSPDASWAKIQQIAASNPRVRGFRLSRNFGQPYAITAGLSVARGNWIVVMDCDLQDPPQAIPVLYDAAKRGHQIVFALREKRKTSLVSRVDSLLFHRAVSALSGVYHDPRIGTLSMISRQVAGEFLRYGEHHRYYIGVLKLVGFFPHLVEVETQPRYRGPTSYTLRKRIHLAVSGITSQSVRALHFALYVGMLFALSAVAVLAWVVWARLTNYIDVPGYASAIGVTLLVGGVVSFILGIIGIYIGHIYEEVKRRPLYLIYDTTDNVDTESRADDAELGRPLQNPLKRRRGSL